MTSLPEADGKRREGGRIVALLGLGGIAGPLVFVIACLVAGTLREGYSQVHQVISDLGVGENGWIVDGACVATGLFLSAFNIGFALSLRDTLRTRARWLCAILLELSPMGLAVAGIFTEAPATLAIHWMLGAALGLYGPLFAFLAVGLALKGHAELVGWARFSLVMWGATLVLDGGMMWGFAPGSSLSVLHLDGLWERLAITAILGWYFVSGFRLRGHGRRRAGA